MSQTQVLCTVLSEELQEGFITALRPALLGGRTSPCHSLNSSTNSLRSRAHYTLLLGPSAHHSAQGLWSLHVQPTLRLATCSIKRQFEGEKTKLTNNFKMVKRGTL